MSSEITELRSVFSSIANAIRGKTGGSNAFAPAELAPAIDGIPSFSEDMVKIIDRTISTFSNSFITTIGNYAFAACNSLTSVNLPSVSIVGSSAFESCEALGTANLPAVTTLGEGAFGECSSLTTVNLPAATTIGEGAFEGCSALTSVSFPVATTIRDATFYGCTALTAISIPTVATLSTYVFANCSALTAISLPAVTTIGSYAFRGCYNLLSLYLTSSSMVILANTNAFISTPISSYTTSTGGVYGSIYVPASLYSSYLTATNWSQFSSRFVSI